MEGMGLQSVSGGDGGGRGPVLLAVSVSTTSFAILMCGVRAIVRLRISRTIGWDDYAIYLAMVGPYALPSPASRHKY
jgi:hypothetical protein